MFYSKILLTLILISIIMPLRVSSLNVNIIDNKFEMLSFHEISKFQDQIAVLCLLEDLPGSYNKAAVLVYNKGTWEKLPYEIVDGSSKSYLLCSTNSIINFDSSGNLWVSGFQMYKYSNGKWKEYSVKDDDWEYRDYNQFVVDKFNNLWITTYVINKETQAQYSELLRFDGESFETILKFDVPFSFIRRNAGVNATGSSIAALPDGKIVLQRTLDKSEEDFKNNKTEDIYFINQDKTYERKKLLTPSGPDFNNHNKNISAIYPEGNDRIWFCLSEMRYLDNSECCSGLTLLENGNWKIFTEENGFEKKSSGNYKPVYRIIKTDDDNYFLIGYKEIYLLDNNFRVKKLSWENLLNDYCKLIISHSYYNGEKGIEYLQGLYLKDSVPLSKPIIGGIINNNGEIWLQLSMGILIFNEPILSVSEDNVNNFIKVYPNPASDFIKLDGSSFFDTYYIINSLGKIVKEGTNNNSEISLTELPSGLYIIRLFRNNQSLKQLTFVKY